MAASTATHNRMLKASGTMLVVAGLLGCGGDTAGPSPLTPETAYWMLQLNQHAVTFALTGSQDTLRLVATPRNVLGQPLANVGTAHFSTGDSSVTVDSTGLVTARFVTSGSTKGRVIASMTDTVRHITLADTCYFQVKATTPALPLANFAIVPASGSDTVMPLGSYYSMTTTATNVNGGTVPLFAHFQSSNPALIVIDGLTGATSAVGTVQAWLSAETWAYGVAKKDSLRFTVIVPSAATVSVLQQTPTGSTHPILTFWPQVVTVSAGARITWSNRSLTDSIDVVFDDPANVDSAKLGPYPFGTGEGNIAPWVNDPDGSGGVSAMICQYYGKAPPACPEIYNFAFTRQRIFPVPGTYHYHSAIWGTSGTIVVQ